MLKIKKVGIKEFLTQRDFRYGGLGKTKLLYYKVL